MDVGRPSALVRDLASALLASQEREKRLREERDQWKLNRDTVQAALMATAAREGVLRESEKRLAEALENANNYQCGETCGVTDHSAECLQSQAALGAYREAGRETT